MEDEFSELIGDLGFFYETWDEVTSRICPKSSIDCEDFSQHYDFQWVCHLMAPDFSDIYAEFFDHFHRYPDDLHQLHPRKFEQLVDAVFRNNGYRTELGPGGADGGIDLRLFQNDMVGEIVTIVQVKRYAANRPIRLEAVHALKAVVDDERANRGLFVSTSRFLPSVKRFAQQHERKIQLATSSDLQEWCEQATIRMRNDMSQRVRSVLESLEGKTSSLGLAGKIVHAAWGRNVLLNDFCVIVGESKSHVLLQPIPSMIVSHDGHKQRGFELPKIDCHLVTTVKIAPFVASKSGNDRFWGQLKGFRLWNGEKVPFDSCD